MQQIIEHLLVLIQFQTLIINYLCVLVFGKGFKPKADKCVDKKYLKLTVDPLPLFGEPPIKQLWQYYALLEKYRRVHGKELKPVKRRGSNTIPPEAVCPYCGAPPDYVYDNNGGRGAFWCKVCDSKFAIRKPSKDDEPYCPFCHYKLELIKKRKSFDVFRCNNRDCLFRKKNLSAMTPEQRKLYKQSPYLFKLRFV